jgi:hypothetical protein
LTPKSLIKGLQQKGKDHSIILVKMSSPLFISVKPDMPRNGLVIPMVACGLAQPDAEAISSAKTMRLRVGLRRHRFGAT